MQHCCTYLCHYYLKLFFFTAFIGLPFEDNSKITDRLSLSFIAVYAIMKKSAYEIHQ